MKVLKIITDKKEEVFIDVNKIAYILYIDNSNSCRISLDNGNLISYNKVTNKDVEAKLNLEII